MCQPTVEMNINALVNLDDGQAIDALTVGLHINILLVKLICFEGPCVLKSWSQF
jgi:hypothetical protein